MAKRTVETRFLRLDFEEENWDSLSQLIKKVERKFEEMDRQIATLEEELSKSVAVYESRHSDEGFYTYVGEALAGSSDSSPVWKISRTRSTPSGDILVEFADGNTNYDNAWTARKNITYAEVV